MPSNVNKNPFGVAANSILKQENQSSWLFSGSTNNVKSTNSLFGQTTAQSNDVQTSAFGNKSTFDAPSSSFGSSFAQTGNNAFGNGSSFGGASSAFGSTTFGGAASFGGTSAFGASRGSTFVSALSNSSTFGGGTTGQASTFGGGPTSCTESSISTGFSA